MTVDEAARLLEVKPATVYALCRAKKLGHMRVGVGRGVIRIEPGDIERFKLDARAKATGEDTPPALPVPSDDRRHVIPPDYFARKPGRGAGRSLPRRPV